MGENQPGGDLHFTYRVLENRASDGPTGHFSGEESRFVALPYTWLSPRQSKSIAKSLGPTNHYSADIDRVFPGVVKTHDSLGSHLHKDHWAGGGITPTRNLWLALTRSRLHGIADLCKRYEVIPRQGTFGGCKNHRPLIPPLPHPRFHFPLAALDQGSFLPA
jgi:hypothetical protein